MWWFEWAWLDDSLDPPPAGQYGYRSYTDREEDAALGTRNGLLDDRCYRAEGPPQAVAWWAADGTHGQSGDWEAPGLLFAFSTEESGPMPPTFGGVG